MSRWSFLLEYPTRVKNARNWNLRKFKPLCQAKHVGLMMCHCFRKHPAWTRHDRVRQLFQSTSFMWAINEDYAIGNLRQGAYFCFALAVRKWWSFIVYMENNSGTKWQIRHPCMLTTDFKHSCTVLHFERTVMYTSKTNYTGENYELELEETNNVRKQWRQGRYNVTII